MNRRNFLKTVLAASAGLATAVLVPKGISLPIKEEVAKEPLTFKDSNQVVNRCGRDLQLHADYERRRGIIEDMCERFGRATAETQEKLIIEELDSQNHILRRSL